MKAKHLFLFSFGTLCLCFNASAQNITENWNFENCPSSSNNYGVDCERVQSGVYATKGIVSGDGTVHTGFTVSVHSPSDIILEDGFEAREGSDFTASILTCTKQTLNPATATTHVELDVAQDNDLAYPNVEPAYAYGFVLPVSNDQVNTSPNYVPSLHNRYFMSMFGPRFAYRETSNTKFFDFHRGEDIVNGSTNNHPNITCVCAGIIEQVVDGTDAQMELTEEGRFVKVKCNATFAANATPAWGNIYTAYRHLQSVAINPTTGQKWKKDDPVVQDSVLGVMGSSGVTTTNHLHFSAQRKKDAEFINVHSMRLFDPASSLPYFPKHLTAQTPPLSDPDDVNATIYQLGYWNTKALFRIVLPATQVNIRAIIVELQGGGYSRTYDFEEVSRVADLQTEYSNESECLDNNEFVPGLALFPYSFNKSSNGRGHYRSTMFCLPYDYPASLQRGLGNSWPVPNDNDVFFDKSSFPLYILDVLVKDLPSGFNIQNLKIKVIDIWGYGMSAFGKNTGQSTFTEPSNAPGPCTITSLPPIPLINNPSDGQHAQAVIPGKTSLTSENARVHIFPNPTAGHELFVEIKGMQSEKAEIMLSNLTGQVLFAQAMLPIEGSRFKLDVGFLKPGAYFVQVKTENQTSVAKFIRQ